MAWERKHFMTFSLVRLSKEFSSACFLEDVTIVIIKQNGFIVATWFYYFEENSLPTFHKLG